MPGGVTASSHFVVSEVIFLRQLLDPWVNLEVVEDVDAFHVTEAVVQDSRQLKPTQTCFYCTRSDNKRSTEQSDTWSR